MFCVFPDSQLNREVEVVDLTRDDSCDHIIDVNSSHTNYVNKCDKTASYSTNRKRAYPPYPEDEPKVKRHCIGSSTESDYSKFHTPISVPGTLYRHKTNHTSRSLTKKYKTTCRLTTNTETYLQEISQLSLQQKEHLLEQYKHELLRLQTETDQQCSQHCHTRGINKSDRIIQANKEWDIMPTPDSEEHNRCQVHMTMNPHHASWYSHGKNVLERGFNKQGLGSGACCFTL